MIYGESAQDLARHFIEYWNHAKIDYEGTKNKKEGTFLKPVRKANYNSSIDSQTFNQADSSDSDELIETSDQGVIGKGLESICETNEEDRLEDSESKVYAVSKNNFNKKSSLGKRLQEEQEDSKIAEADEDEEGKEDQTEEEEKQGNSDHKLKNNDSINVVNEDESEEEDDHPSSEDRESDYLSDEEEEDKKEEEDKVFDIEPLKVSSDC